MELNEKKAQEARDNGLGALQSNTIAQPRHILGNQRSPLSSIAGVVGVGAAAAQYNQSPLPSDLYPIRSDGMVCTTSEKAIFRTMESISKILSQRDSNDNSIMIKQEQIHNDMEYSRVIEAELDVYRLMLESLLKQSTDLDAIRDRLIESVNGNGRLRDIIDVAVFGSMGG